MKNGQVPETYDLPANPALADESVGPISPYAMKIGIYRDASLEVTVLYCWYQDMAYNLKMYQAVLEPKAGRKPTDRLEVLLGDTYIAIKSSSPEEFCAGRIPGEDDEPYVARLDLANKDVWAVWLLSYTTEQRIAIFELAR